MRDLRLGDFCWFRGEGWIYLGMCEDGVVHLCRHVKGCRFGTIEFENVYIGEDGDDVDEFYSENGECFTEYCRRKDIDIP